MPQQFGSGADIYEWGAVCIFPVVIQDDRSESHLQGASVSTTALGGTHTTLSERGVQCVVGIACMARIKGG